MEREEIGGEVTQKRGGKWLKKRKKKQREFAGSHRWSSRRRPSVSGSCGRGGGWVWLKTESKHTNNSASTLCPLQAATPSTVSCARCRSRLSSAELPQSISSTHTQASSCGLQQLRRRYWNILAAQHPQAPITIKNQWLVLCVLTHRYSSTAGPRWTRSPARRRCSAGTSPRTWWEREAHGAGCTPSAWSPAGGRSCGSRGSWPCRGCTARPRCAPASPAGWCCSAGSRCPGSRWRWPAPCSPLFSAWIR